MDYSYKDIDVPKTLEEIREMPLTSMALRLTKYPPNNEPKSEFVKRCGISLKQYEEILSGEKEFTEKEFLGVLKNIDSSFNLERAPLWLKGENDFLRKERLNKEIDDALEGLSKIFGEPDDEF